MQKPRVRPTQRLRLPSIGWNTYPVQGRSAKSKRKAKRKIKMIQGAKTVSGIKIIEKKSLEKNQLKYGKKQWIWLTIRTGFKEEKPAQTYGVLWI